MTIHTKAQWIARVSIAVIALGVLRALSLILASPVHGYADQGDAIRTGACVGARPAVAAFSVPSTPVISKYLRTQVDPTRCAFSAAVPMVQVALAVDSVFRTNNDGGFDIRFLGMLYFLALVSIAVAIDHATTKRPRLRLANAAIFALVLCDPAVTLYFNTLLTEPIALIGLYASLAVLTFTSRGTTTRLLITFAVASLVLALSRTQHFVLPLIFACALWFVSRRETTRMKFAPFVIAIVAATISLQQSNNTGNLRTVNRANAVLHVLAPASNDSHRFMSRLGLDEACIKLVGASWFQQYGHDVQNDCPALAKVTNARLAAALLIEPMVMLRAIHKSLLFSGNVRSNFLGEVTSTTDTSSRDTLGAFGMSIFDTLPETGMVKRLAFVSFVLLLAVASILRKDRNELDYAVQFLAVIAIFVWSLSLIGDGFSELSRHAHLAALCVCAIVVIVFLRVARLKDIARIGACAGLAMVLALAIHRSVAVSHATPNVRNNVNGLLVLSSHEVTKVVVSTDELQQREVLLDQVDAFTQRVVGVPASLLGWMPSPFPAQRDGTCRKIRFDFFHANGLRSSRDQCVRAI
jgi:hypothetical protein